MVDQTRITSGFDLELLLSERYIKYFLLTSFETGSIPWWTEDVDDATGEVTNIIIHPPSELIENRLYEPHPDFVPHPFLDIVPIVYTDNTNACEVTLLPDEEEADIRVQLIVSVIAPPLGPGGAPIIFTEQQMHLDARFFVAADTDANGFQRNVRLRLELVDIGGPFIALAEGFPRFDKAQTLLDMKEDFDRDMPLSIVGEGGSILQIETQKFFAEDEDDPPTCLGIYVNLNLRNGPEPTAFYGARGDLALAHNFLPKKHHLAFGFNGNLYEKIGNDIFQRMAAPKTGGGFFYPLDPEAPNTGKIIHALVYPQGRGRRTETGDTETLYDNILVIEIEGEYFVEDFIDPNFKMKIRLIPVIEDDVLTFKTDFDLSIPAIGWLVVGTALLSFLTLKLAIPATIAVLAFKAIIENHFEGEAVPRIEAQLEDASLLESFPNKLTVEQRRWDPAYFTLHQIVSLVKDVAINDKGMAFAAYDLRVGKEPKPLENSIIRSEVRDPLGNVSGLMYRINDWNPQFEKELDLIFPATDRMEFVEIVPGDGGVEATRLHLTVDQAVARVHADRIVEKILYTPYKVDETDHQIYQILVLSKVEVPEIKARARSLLRRELEQAHAQEYRDQARAELLAELGREPTPEEIQSRYGQILSAEVNAGAEKRYRRERERFLKCDLEPFEFADLQQKKILVLEHVILEIIKMRDSVGGTVYYRDVPDQDEGDNLLELPHYKAEKIVRA